jgi:hypothetical protein
MGVKVQLAAHRGPLRGRLARVVALAASAAALALVALPTGASADLRVPPPACPSGVSLQDLGRAPGGVIFSGTVVAVTPEVGRVRLAVDTWFHRSVIAGLRAGEHPATIDVTLAASPAAGPAMGAAGPGAGLSLGPGAGRSAGAEVPGVVPASGAEVPAVGSRWIVAGTWTGPPRGVAVDCGIFADLATPAGAAWLERAETSYLGVAPSRATGVPPLPLDAPWFGLGVGAAITFLLATCLGALAQARDPLPAV